jgi:hypothetical protein
MQIVPEKRLLKLFGSTGEGDMDPNEQRLMKAFELSAFTKALLEEGLRKRFPDLSEEELHRVFLERLARCHNQNY